MSQGLLEWSFAFLKFEKTVLNGVLHVQTYDALHVNAKKT